MLTRQIFAEVISIVWGMKEEKRKEGGREARRKEREGKGETGSKGNFILIK